MSPNTVKLGEFAGLSLFTSCADALSVFLYYFGNFYTANQTQTTDPAQVSPDMIIQIMQNSSDDVYM